MSGVLPIIQCHSESDIGYAFVSSISGVSSQCAGDMIAGDVAFEGCEVSPSIAYEYLSA